MNKYRKKYYWMSNETVEHLINKYIRSDEYRKILRLRMLNRYTYERISEETQDPDKFVHPYSARQIFNIVKTKEDEMFSKYELSKRAAE